MPVAKPASSEARVIAHLDMDCFYVQVEQRKQPQLRGLPTAVVQYNEWKGGGLIAVSYEARKYGVKRSMRGDEAKSVCPQIQLVQVPIARGKADLSIYRDAGSEVVSILAKTGRCERASIDEVYLDLTDAAETMLAETPPESLDDLDDEALKSHVLGLDDVSKPGLVDHVSVPTSNFQILDPKLVGYPVRIGCCKDGTDAKECVRIWLQRSDADHNDKLLSCGALIVAELRNNVLKETEFTCSAGIAHNKMLAKLASGLNKPAQQTIVPSASVKEFLGPWPIKKMKQLGGKLGDSLQSDLGINTVGDLLQFSEQKLQERCGFNTGGVSGEEVKGRILPQSHGSGKTFPGPRALRSIDTVSHWLKKLCEELSERILADLDQNKRIAHTLTLHVRANKSSDTDSQKRFPSKSCPLRYGIIKIQEDALSLFHAGLREFLGTYGARSEKNQNNEWGITGLSISASKIISAQLLLCLSSFDERDCVASENNWNSESGAFVETEDNTIMRDISSLDQNVDERISQKNQGTPSILKFLKRPEHSCSELKHEPNGTLQIIHMPTCSGGNMLQNTENAVARENWSYDVDEIDPTIIEELPADIQEELRDWMRPLKQRHSAKRSNITSYFLPSKDSSQ
uniref:DNA polymerase eta n=1 Tax=Chenopodium quinoa TaxID=63459 RepID=A0A803MZN9_CHEQI